jgi:F-type H+-transporting ATPase subunit delta
MSAEVIVQKYSQALFETTEAANKTEGVAAELEQVAALLGQADVQSFFTSPFNSLDTKIMVAKSALEGKCSPELFNFVVTVVEKERMGLIAEINTHFQALVRAKTGETEGTLFAAADVTDAFRAQVEAQLSKTLNKRVKLNVQKDASLLSGFKVSIAGWTLDDSAQFHLNKIKDEISKRGI